MLGIISDKITLHTTPHMFNPLKYRYRATYVGEEGSDVFLQLTQGAQSQLIRFPKSLLPENFNPQESIQIGIHPESSKDELGTLKSLLQELIN